MSNCHEILASTAGEDCFSPTASQSCITPPKPFTYSELDTSTTGSIRLLAIAAGHYSQPINCSLVCCYYSNPSLPYEALSYVWGNAQVKEPIILDGHAFQVTKNLECALRHLRLPDRQRMLWVDAICINQADQFERSEQVQQMGEIYEHANCVLIWLGEADEDSDRAFAFANVVGTVVEGSVYPLTDQFDFVRFNTLGTIGLVKDYIDSSNEDYTAEWLSLGKLLQRPWWQRVWVVQELAKAKEAVFVCGWTTTPSSRLHCLVMIVHLTPVIQDFIKRYISNIDIFLQQAYLLFHTRLRRLRAETLSRREDMKFSSLLETALQRLCQDPSDKVYAVLSLTNAAVQSQFRSDYTQSMEWAYTMAVKADVETSRSIEILCCCRTNTTHDSLPSWAPDWSRSKDMNSVGGFLGKSIYKASTPDPWSNTWYPSPFSGDLRTLRASGCCVGMVLEVNFEHCDKDMEVDESTKSCVTWSIQNIVKRFDELRGTILHTKPESPPRSLSDSRPVNGNSDSAEAADTVFRTLVFNRELTATVDRILSSPYLVQDPLSHEAWPHAKDRLEYLRRAKECTWGRTLTLSTGRFLGLCPRSTIPGDLVWVLGGLSVPAILRLRTDGAYTFIGDAYVHGIMYGEVMRVVGKVAYLPGIRNGEIMQVVDKGPYNWKEIDLR
jgi:hypothetical protein